MVLVHYHYHWSLNLLYNRNATIEIYADVSRNIMTTSMNETNTLLYKNIPLTLYSKGLNFLVCERWVGVGDRLLHIDPKFFFDHSSTSSTFCWAAQPWVLRAANWNCSHASIFSPTATRIPNRTPTDSSRLRHLVI